MDSLRRFCRFTWYYTLFVILFGAWVRLTGSGAGCGEHWPLCDGQVIPRAPEMEQMIEYTHRVTSGIYGFMVLGLCIGVFRLSKNKPLRWSALAVLIFTVIEALIGAVLVKRGLVADNSSFERAAVIALHLANTFLLFGALTITDFYLHRWPPPTRWTWPKIKDLGISAMWLAVGATGAITALGDTLFPHSSLKEGLIADIEGPLLLRLRVFHPFFAIATSALVIWRTKSATPLTSFILGNILVGFLNVFLLVPHWTALTHLLLADIIWALWVRWQLEQQVHHGGIKTDG